MRGNLHDDRIEKDKGIDFGYVGKDGSIVIVNETTKMIIVARPSFAGDAISWKCYAYPEKANALDLLSDCGKKFRLP